MLRACLDCGALSKEPRCPRCRHNDTGQRGSTRAWRKIRARVLKRDHHRCFYCGEPADQVDHLLPVQRGGKDTEANLVAACAGCNHDKGNRTAEEFR